MTTFADLRTQLAQARTQKSAADAQVAQQSAQLKAIQSQIAALSRLGPAQSTRLASLQKQADALTTIFQYESDTRWLALRSHGRELCILSDVHPAAERGNDGIVYHRLSKGSITRVPTHDHRRSRMGE